MIDELKAMIPGLEENEREAVFAGAHSIGEAVGRKLQTLDLIRKLEEDRKVVSISGKPVETTARNPKPEKR
jgi:hypothetical protein